jgi:predicted dehydrogenase
MIKTALVSFGMSGRVFHAPFIHLNPNFMLAGAWERSSKNIQAVYPGVTSYAFYDEILTDPSIDLVVVNSPNDTHFAYTKQALLAGKHVVVEKAFTVTVEEAEELAALAVQQQKILTVYQNRRFDADFLTIQKLISQNKIGHLLDVQISYERYRTTLSPKVHKEQPTPGAGVLLDLGPHLVDQAIQLSGMPTAVFADIRVTRSVSLVDDYFTLLLYYPTHRILLTSGMVFMQQGPGYKIYGTNGCFIKNRSDVQEDLLLAGHTPGGENWGQEDPKNYGTLTTDSDGVITSTIIESERGDYGKYYEAVAAAILENKPVPVTPQEGINIMKVLVAAKKSYETKQVVHL